MVRLVISERLKVKRERKEERWKMKKSKSLPVDSPSTLAYKPSKADIDREKWYRAENAIRTLKEADEIKRDKSLMRDCKQYVKEQAKTINKI